MNRIDILVGADPIPLTLFLTGIQVILVSLECLYHRALYQPTHLLSWKYLKASRKIFTATSAFGFFFDRLFRYPDVLFLITLRMLTAGFIIINLLYGRIFPAAVIILCSLGLLVSLRNAHSDNGSDQLSNILLVSVSIIYLTGNAGFTRVISILYIACQGALAYLTAGFLKVASRNWRNGNSLKDIISTGMFGNKHVKAALDRHSGSYRLSSAILIGWEILMGFCFLFPPQICLLFLGGGIVFHFLVASIMGFNTFLWAFLSTYPSMYFISCKVH